MCEWLGVSRSGFYAWSGRAPSVRAQQDERLRVQVREAHERSRRTYGSPRVHAELAANGVRISRKRVVRLMQDQKLVARERRRQAEPRRRQPDAADDRTGVGIGVRRRAGGVFGEAAQQRVAAPERGRIGFVQR